MAKVKSLVSELARIRDSLKAPKGQYNSFGKYRYRSCEDILEAVKPLLDDCNLTMSDSVIECGGRVFVKATVTLWFGDAYQSVDALACHPETKKGMDASQITGAASSYARKYALNGLFCIDDTKDADATNTHGKGGAGAGQNSPSKDWGALIMQCESIAQLKALWTSIPAAERGQFEAAKEKAKSVLGGE